MKQTLKILILSCVVFLGLWSETSAATNITVKSCPRGSTVVGCDNGLLNPGADLVLEFQGIDPKNVTGVVLVPSPVTSDKTYRLPATPNGKFVVAKNIPTDLKEINWSVGYIENGTEKLASSNIILGLPMVGGGTGGTGGNAGNAGGTGGNSAYQDCLDQWGDVGICADEDRTPGSGSGQGSENKVSSGASGGGVRTGLSALQGEFPTSGDIAGAGSIGKLIVGVIKFLLAILLALTVLMIVIGGFMFVTSAGNEDRAKSGRKTLTYAIIGLIIVLLSWMIVNVVERAVRTGNPTSGV